MAVDVYNIAEPIEHVWTIDSNNHVHLIMNDVALLRHGTTQTLFVGTKTNLKDALMRVAKHKMK